MQKKLNEKKILTEEEYKEVKRRRKKEFSLKDLKKIIVSICFIVLSIGIYYGFTAYAEHRKEVIENKIISNNVDSKAEFDKEVLLRLEQEKKKENREKLIQSVKDGITIEPLQVVTNYTLDVVEEGAIKTLYNRYKSYDMVFKTDFNYDINDIKIYDNPEADAVFIEIDKSLFDVDTTYYVENQKDTLDDDGNVKKGWWVNNDRISASHVEIEKEKQRLLIHNSTITEENFDKASDKLKEAILNIANQLDVEVKFVISGTIDVLKEYGYGETNIAGIEPFVPEEGSVSYETVHK